MEIKTGYQIGFKINLHEYIQESTTPIPGKSWSTAQVNMSALRVFSVVQAYIRLKKGMHHNID